MRFSSADSAEAINFVPPPTLSQENNRIESNFSEPKTEDDEIESNYKEQNAESKSDCSETVKEDENFGTEEDEEESPKLVFKFEYQTWNLSEELNESNSERYDFVNPETAVSSISRYEFVSGKSFSHFLEEPEVPNFTVKEVYINSSDEPLENKDVNDSGFSAKRDFKAAEIPENPKEKVNDSMASAEKPCCENDGRENSNDTMKDKEASAADDFLSEDDFMGLDSESDSTNLDSLFESQLNCSTSDGFMFLSDTDFGTSFDGENAVDLEFEKLDVGYEAEDFDEDEDRDVMEEYRKIESEVQNPDEFSHQPNREKDESAKSAALDSSEDSSHLETLWEHQDLIEQLKMELKKVRATGLPTILEDSESPRMVEDLKPWKIDEKFHHGNGINELPKFYRSYRERMRKFDILNYQKMYAIGYLQSKDPLKSFSGLKSSGSAVTSLLSQHLGLNRSKKTDSDPMKKFIRELYCDLEIVYVGQLCLSWEFLQWEYEKALELWESHQHGSPSYNEVAGEFQQFQVLLQRFIENEPFQGPRVENYVRNRCVMKNLLQVPVIREDSSKDKRKQRKREADSDGITSEMLVEILEESIRTIWRFIRADKDASSTTLKGMRGLQDPADSELFMQIRADLQKKEKRLKEVLRSGKCVLKKLKKHKEDGNTEQFLYFFSQVDMKLVWRVLNMSRITTDQLAWCRSKLDKINFVNRRRIHVDPSFLLFPC
ncbi:hypothetical protein L6164_006816 [Bauhinia variegata]|uniref:Uncharacterized protein n=1 Tax=Bauhinia variegata TaxID=167791 RepID=A0ACB9PVN6_BAUVA|nr:hypothetical protein L6164_006816 [Bauhinia variegata]